jgi:uncharacterized protein with HEPN domain
MMTTKEKTNLEQAVYSMDHANKVSVGSVIEKSYRDDAIAYALIAIAETLAEINQKMPSRSPATAAYTPGDEG